MSYFFSIILEGLLYFIELPLPDRLGLDIKYLCAEIISALF